jgi:hypothetical protein
MAAAGREALKTLLVYVEKLLSGISRDNPLYPTIQSAFASLKALFDSGEGWDATAWATSHPLQAFVIALGLCAIAAPAAIWTPMLSAIGFGTLGPCKLKGSNIKNF